MLLECIDATHYHLIVERQGSALRAQAQQFDLFSLTHNVSVLRAEADQFACGSHTHNLPPRISYR